MLLLAACSSAIVLTTTSCKEPLRPEDTAVHEADPSLAANASNTAPVISNLKVASGKAYKVVAGGMTAGAKLYIDRSYTAKSPVPSVAEGLMYIQTANGDETKNAGSTSLLSFDVDRDVDVYVAHDDVLPRPSWLRSNYQDVGVDLVSSDKGRRLSLFKRSFPKGRVTLGSNVDKVNTAGTMYVVMVAGTSPGGASPSADTTAPKVQITAPAAGATVSGTVTVTATASDNIGVSGVQFQLDGSALAPEDTSAPYSISWNTANTSDGAHTLTAIARDAAGNTATATVQVTVKNGAGTGSHKGWFVAPNGSSGGNGSASRPWDLKTALAGAGGKVQPGDTVWLRGGTYRGSYTSTLKGTASAPIVVRQYPNERAILDGNGSSSVVLKVSGPYTVFWGFEVMNSYSNRSVYRPNGVYAYAPNLKFINLVVHDVNVGFTFSNESPASEIYGSIIYNNGHQGTSRGHGHAIYAKNDGSTLKLIRDNIMFNQYGYGVHVYTDAGSGQLRNIRIEGNASFNNGTLSSNSTSANMLVGGYEPADRIAVVDNMLYFSPGVAGINARLGYGKVQGETITASSNYAAGGNPVLQMGHWNKATVTGNHLYGTARLIYLYDPSLSGYTWSSNQYFGATTSSTAFRYLSSSYTFDKWKQLTGLGAGDVSSSGTPSGAKVFVRPNQYEKGRANIVVYNWGGQGSVRVDLSKVLSVGDRYEVRNVQNLFGTPVATGTYGGGTISLPMAGVTPPRPIGGSKSGPKTGPYFDAFLVTKTN
jgi:hypothetical protein